MTMLPSSRPQTSRPWAGMYTLAVTFSGSLMFGIKLSWSIIPAGRGVSLSKASWRDIEVVACSPVGTERKKLIKEPEQECLHYEISKLQLLVCHNTLFKVKDTFLRSIPWLPQGQGSYTRKQYMRDWENIRFKLQEVITQADSTWHFQTS